MQQRGGAPCQGLGPGEERCSERRAGHWSRRWWMPMEFLMNLGKRFKEKLSIWDSASPEDTQ